MLSVSIAQDERPIPRLNRHSVLSFVGMTSDPCCRSHGMGSRKPKIRARHERPRLVGWLCHSASIHHGRTDGMKYLGTW